MPIEGDVRSDNVAILLNGRFITGVSQYSLSSDLEITPLHNLGDQHFSGYLKPENQTHKLDISWAHSVSSADVYLGEYSLTDNKYFVTGAQQITIRDPVEQQLISGAYITSFGMNFAVGQVPSFDVSFDCDTVDINTASLTTKGVDTFEGTVDVFEPQNVEVTTVSTNPLVNFGTECVQSASISVNIPRTMITRLGDRIPTHRVIRGTATATATLSVLKDRAKDMPTDYLNKVQHDIGTLTISIDTLTTDDPYVVTVSDLAVKSVQDGLDVDGNEIIEYTYEGAFNQNTFSAGYT